MEVRTSFSEVRTSFEDTHHVQRSASSGGIDDCAKGDIQVEVLQPVFSKSAQFHQEIRHLRAPSTMITSGLDGDAGVGCDETSSESTTMPEASALRLARLHRLCRLDDFLTNQKQALPKRAIPKFKVDMEQVDHKGQLLTLPQLKRITCRQSGEFQLEQGDSCRVQQAPHDVISGHLLRKAGGLEVASALNGTLSEVALTEKHPRRKGDAGYFSLV